MKTCTKCGVSQPEAGFRPQRRVCRECERAVTRRWIADNPDRRERNKQRHKREVECPGCGDVRKVQLDKIKRKGYTGLCRSCVAATAGLTNARHKLPVLRPTFDPSTTRRWREAAAKIGAATRSTRVLVAGSCARCGKPFVGTHLDARYCSARCQRAKLRTGPRFKIAKSARLAIYERDGWVCQLCGDPVDPDLHWSDDWAPSLDHIICQSWTDEPDHSPENLRLAHRWCNSVRNDERTYTADVLAA